MTTATRPTKTIEQSSGNEVRRAMLRLCHDLAIIPVDPDIVVDEVISRVRNTRIDVLSNDMELLELATALNRVRGALSIFDDKMKEAIKKITDNAIHNVATDVVNRVL